VIAAPKAQQNEHVAAHPQVAAEHGTRSQVARGAPAAHVSNHVVLRRLQTKLTVSTPGDAFEQEADRVADQVMRMPEPLVQRACACGGSCDSCKSGSDHHDEASHKVQLKHADHGSPVAEAPPAVNDALAGAGRPLDGGTRAYFEPRLGADLSGVRVHEDARAAESAQSVNALAYTVGRDIVFAPGQYRPASRDGQRLLAHELTHVLQQTAQGGLALQRFVPCTRARLSLEDCPKREPNEVAEARTSPMVVEYLTAPEQGYLISNFAVGQSRLKPNAKNEPNWAAMIAALSDKTTVWTIIGLGDCHGDDALNESLRKDRGEQVLNALPPEASKQISSVQAAALHQCLTTNDSSIDRAYNRSVLIQREKQELTYEEEVIEGERPVPKPKAQPTVDCNNDQKKELAAAHPIAIAMVERAMAVFPERHRRPEIRDLLKKYFNDPDGNWRIYAGLKAILGGLKTSTKLECESKGDVAYNFFCPSSSTKVSIAYVRTLAGFRVHLCEAAFGRSDLDLADTLVHEYSHLYDHTNIIQKETYCWQGGCDKLSRWDAYDNADSFSSFAAEVFKRQL
jgi:hypothetical protein